MYQLATHIFSDLRISLSRDRVRSKDGRYFSEINYYKSSFGAMPVYLAKWDVILAHIEKKMSRPKDTHLRGRSEMKIFNLKRRKPSMRETAASAVSREHFFQWVIHCRNIRQMHISETTLSDRAISLKDKWSKACESRITCKWRETAASITRYTHTHKKYTLEG